MRDKSINKLNYVEELNRYLIDKLNKLENNPIKPPFH